MGTAKKRKTNIYPYFIPGLIMLLFFLFGCESTAVEGASASGEEPRQDDLALFVSGDKRTDTQTDTRTDAQTDDDAPHGDLADEAPRIRILDTAGVELWSFTEDTLKSLIPEAIDMDSNVYSTMNNWPTARFYAAEGYVVEGILYNAGVLDTVRTVTFRAADGYEISMTMEQLFEKRYCYPQLGENDLGARRVAPMIAYRWREGTDDIGGIRDDRPLLIFGQRDPFEQTNPAFVVGVSEMIVDAEPCEKWPPPGAFPLPGPIAAGETVKLQHPDIGRVKLHYTLDGSDPTALSPMYNPSTYQPELSRPIAITESVTIKVIAVGYGKEDSEIAVLEYGVSF